MDIDYLRDELKKFPFVRVLLTGIVVGVAFAAFADYQRLGLTGDFAIVALWRSLYAIIGGIIGWLLGTLTAGMAGSMLNTVRSGGYEFAEPPEMRVRNAFIFVIAIAGAAISLIFIKLCKQIPHPTRQIPLLLYT